MKLLKDALEETGTTIVGGLQTFRKTRSMTRMPKTIALVVLVVFFVVFWALLAQL